MNLAVRVWTDHAYKMPCLKCELPYLLEVSRPPDPELVNLIEQAVLEGQIDSQKAELAYLCLLPVLRAKAGTFAGIRSN